MAISFDSGFEARRIHEQLLLPLTVIFCDALHDEVVLVQIRYTGFTPPLHETAIARPVIVSYAISSPRAFAFESVPLSSCLFPQLLPLYTCTLASLLVPMVPIRYSPVTGDALVITQFIGARTVSADDCALHAEPFQMRYFGVCCTPSPYPMSASEVEVATRSVSVENVCNPVSVSEFHCPSAVWNQVATVTVVSMVRL